MFFLGWKILLISWIGASRQLYTGQVDSWTSSYHTDNWESILACWVCFWLPDALTMALHLRLCVQLMELPLPFCTLLNCFALRQELWLLDEDGIYSLKLLGEGSGLVGAGVRGEEEQWWGYDKVQ